MDVTVFDTGPAGLAQWRALATPLLTADPVLNTIALTALAEHGTPLPGPRIVTLLTVADAGRTVAAAVRFDGYCLQVCAVPPECADAVADALAADEPLWRRGVFGAVGSVDALVRARTARTGEQAVPDVEMRLWTLGTLAPPTGVAGTPRPAAPRDGDLLAAWMRAFAADVAVDHAGRPVADEPEPDHSGLVAAELARGRDPVIWEVDGRPVAMAVGRTPAAGVARLGPVYTPPEHRGHGYASAVTAAGAARALAAGARWVVLFTDVAADVPNRIYGRIGFEPGGLHREMRFEPARDGARARDGSDAARAR